jgi:hypothetical protein
MKHVLLIAAPFGFGPGSMALALAEYLHGKYRVSICTSGSAADFVAANAGEGVQVIRGVFRNVFATRESLAAYGAFIAINQVPALRHLAALGLGGVSIFLDTLAEWRAEYDREPLPGGLLGHFVQDELHGPDGRRAAHPTGAVVVGPVLWPPEGVPAVARERRGILVHTGGMTSPLAGHDPVNVIAAQLVWPIVLAIAARGERVTVMGNAEVLRRQAPAADVELLGSVSPARAQEEIATTKLLVTTPGTGAVLEAMALRTPILLLPPMNSTQLQHNDVFSARGIEGILGDGTREQISARLRPLPWSSQTPALLNALAQNAAQIARMAEQPLDRLINALGQPEVERYVARVDALWATLSRTSAKEVILGALAQLGEHSRSAR